MTYQTTFPDFTLDVAIPSGFEDVSYVNDACPSWRDETARLELFINYTDPERREDPEMPRFFLMKLKPDEPAYVETLVETDDWAEMLAAIEKHRKG